MRRKLGLLGDGGSPGPEETSRAFQESFRRKPWLGVMLNSGRQQEQGACQLFRMRCDKLLNYCCGWSTERSRILEKLPKCRLWNLEINVMGGARESLPHPPTALTNSPRLPSLLPFSAALLPFPARPAAENTRKGNKNCCWGGGSVFVYLCSFSYPLWLLSSPRSSPGYSSKWIF